ncbi:MAG: hypothetical protein QOF77_2164 [Solirubrobacteraceae bacterium]|jgi:hypothetical protein|nr:hypothetical protein [Solirubrobacteraceae bacterium]
MCHNAQAFQVTNGLFTKVHAHGDNGKTGSASTTSIRRAGLRALGYPHHRARSPSPTTFS